MAEQLVQVMELQEKEAQKDESKQQTPQKEPTVN